MTMECPVCHQPMEQLSLDTSSNADTNVSYQRIRFVCHVDDAWVKVEVPLIPESNK